jgi:hypothetical protein
MGEHCALNTDAGQAVDVAVGTSLGTMVHAKRKSMAKIGKREQVSDIRQIWPREPDFPDWLATEQGIELLGQDLELDVETLEREEKASEFRCDLVGHATGDENHKVVIENQYGRINHDHLAKLLTYVATHNATTAVWIAEEVAEDHRVVIDWLNNNTPANAQFIAAELKLWRIGSSDPAPQLDVVCRPNVMLKPIESEPSEADAARYEWRRQFWTDIHARVPQSKPPFRLQRPGRDSWSSLAIGRGGFHVNMLLTPIKRRVGVELVVKPAGWKQSAFDQLEAQKAEIESELGAQLNWRAMPDNVKSCIVLEEKIDPAGEANRKAVCDWFAEWLPKMHATFRQRVADLIEPDPE